MKRRTTALDRALVALDRDLVRAVVRALDRARDVDPASARDLPRELELARDLAQELEYARAGNARDLASALELVRALELGPARAAVPDPTRSSALDLELELERKLDLAFVRALAVARIVNRVRALVRALVRARDFVATYEDERAFGRGARVMLGRAMGVLIALAVQVLPVSRQPRHLEEFCAELLELRWWQWPWHALCILLHVGGLRRALNEAVGTPEDALAHRAKR